MKEIKYKHCAEILPSSLPRSTKDANTTRLIFLLYSPLASEVSTTPYEQIGHVLKIRVWFCMFVSPSIPFSSLSKNYQAHPTPHYRNVSREDRRQKASEENQH